MPASVRRFPCCRLTVVCCRGADNALMQAAQTAIEGCQGSNQQVSLPAEPCSGIPSTSPRAPVSLRQHRPSLRHAKRSVCREPSVSLPSQPRYRTSVPPHGIHAWPSFTSGGILCLCNVGPGSSPARASCAQVWFDTTLTSTDSPPTCNAFMVTNQPTAGTTTTAGRRLAATPLILLASSVPTGCSTKLPVLCVKASATS